MVWIVVLDWWWCVYVVGILVIGCGGVYVI